MDSFTITSITPHVSCTVKEVKDIHCCLLGFVSNYNFDAAAEPNKRGLLSFGSITIKIFIMNTTRTYLYKIPFQLSILFMADQIVVQSRRESDRRSSFHQPQGPYQGVISAQDASQKRLNKREVGPSAHKAAANNKKLSPPEDLH